MNSSDYIQEDIRLINLYSQSSTTYLNGTLKSNVNFNFKNILREEPDIIYSTIGVVNAQIPVSYYTINEYNDTLYYTTNIATPVYSPVYITRGNYNASSLRTELQTQLIAGGITGMVVTINSSTGKLVFTASIPFAFAPSSSFDILGFANNPFFSVANVITAPFLLNLLGIQQLRINSNALACSNSNSTQMGESNLIAVIQSTAPPFGMILYANQTSYSVLRSKTISLIDIQILDEDGNFVDFNNVDWTITLQLTIFRKIPLPSNSADFLRPILATLGAIEQDLEGGNQGTPATDDSLGGQDPAPDDPAQDLVTQENQQQQDLLNNDENSLDIMSYNKQLPA